MSPSNVARRLRSPALAERLPGAIYSRNAEAALNRGEFVDADSYDVDAAPYTESPAARLHAVERHTETIVELPKGRWA